MAKDKTSQTDNFRTQRASLALALAGNEWGGDPDNLLWECIAAIGTFGTSAKLKRQFDVVREVAFINRDLPAMNEEDRKRQAASLNELGGYILAPIARMERIEDKVSALGCRVNPETGKVSTKQKSKGRDKVRERILKIYTESYREEYQGATTKRQFAIRQAIGKRLSDHIDERELSPDANAGALIYDTIRKGEDHSPKE